MALLLLVTVILYLPTLDFPFQYDDYAALVNNPGLRVNGWGLDALKECLANAPRFERRPVAQVGFALTWRLFAFQPAGWRAINIALHLGNVLLLFLIGRLLLPHFSSDERLVHWSSLAGSTLWAFHPVHTQAVTYIVQRVTSQMTFFFLSAVFLYLVFRKEAQVARRFSALAGMSACFLLALGSKENAAVFPMAILLMEAAMRGGFAELFGKRRVLLIWTVGMAAYLILLAAVFTGGTLGIEGYSAREFSLLQRVLSESRVMVTYISLLILPFPWRLTIDKDTAVSVNLFEPWTTLPSLFFILALLVFSMAFFRKWTTLCLSVLWFFLTIAIESTVVPLDLYYEHRLYLPTTLPALMIGLLVTKAIRKANRDDEFGNRIERSEEIQPLTGN